jgi:hypothetical protein
MAKLARRTGAIGLAFGAYDLWKRMSPQQRKVVIRQARKYGPKVADRVATFAKARRGRS